MDNEPQNDPFTGNWLPQSFDGSLTISTSPMGSFHIHANGEDVGPLVRDEKWHNLKSAEACLSLHGKNGRLFGIYLLPSGYQTVAAVRPGAGIPAPVCGKDSEIFERMLAPGGFVLKTLRVNETQAPAGVGDRIAVRRSSDTADYQIGKIAGSAFTEFDQLCPDAENGCLNSRNLRVQGTMRSVTLWERSRATPVLFSMVAIPREAVKKVRDMAGADQAELARSLGLLPFELDALLEMPELPYAPGDPLIVWGADDGGG